MWADYHEFGGDPCNKTRKYIEVHYYCHDGTEGTDKGIGGRGAEICNSERCLFRPTAFQCLEVNRKAASEGEKTM